MPLQTRVAFDHMKLPGKWSIQLPCDILVSAFPALARKHTIVRITFRRRRILTNPESKDRNPLRRIPRGNENAPGSRGAAIAEIRFDLRHARSVPEALAT